MRVGMRHGTGLKHQRPGSLGESGKGEDLGSQEKFSNSTSRGQPGGENFA